MNIALIAAAVLTALPTVVLAAADPHGAHDAPGGHGPGGSNPLAGDLGNAIWTLVIFGALVYVLGKFAWGPLLAGLKAREDAIKERIDAAERDRLRAVETLAEYERKLAVAAQEVAALLETAKKDAERIKSDILASAGRESDELRSRARRDIESARDAALQEIYTTSAQLATDIAGRILRREIRPEDQRALIEEGLAAYKRN